MNNHNQEIKLCGICGNERVFNEYHRLYNPCKKCVAKNSAPYYQGNRDKLIARSKLYQQNTEYVRKSPTQQREELNKEVEELKRAMETLILKSEKIYINMQMALFNDKLSNL